MENAIWIGQAITWIVILTAVFFAYAIIVRKNSITNLIYGLITIAITCIIAKYNLASRSNLMLFPLIFTSIVNIYIGLRGLYFVLRDYTFGVKIKSKKQAEKSFGFRASFLWTDVMFEGMKILIDQSGQETIAFNFSAKERHEPCNLAVTINDMRYKHIPDISISNIPENGIVKYGKIRMKSDGERLKVIWP